MRDEFDLFVLQVICKVTPQVIRHMCPPEVFVKRLPYTGRKIKKALTNLIISGYVQLHPDSVIIKIV